MTPEEWKKQCQDQVKKTEAFIASKLGDASGFHQFYCQLYDHQIALHAAADASPEGSLQQRSFRQQINFLTVAIYGLLHVGLATPGILADLPEVFPNGVRSEESFNPSNN